MRPLVLIALPRPRPGAGAAAVRRARPLAVTVAALVVASVSPLALLAPVPAGAASTDSPSLVAADAGAPSSTLYPAEHLFPSGSGDQRAVVRDCGLSTPLPNGHSLWVFCDTVVFDGVHGSVPDLNATTRLVSSGTAALAPTRTNPTPAAPVELHEANFPNLPQRLLSSSGLHGAGADRQSISCPTGVGPFAWSKGLVTLPGTQKVLVFFQDHCPDIATGYAEYDVGIGELEVPATDASDFSAAGSLQLSTRHDSVLVNPTPGSSHKWGYATAPVLHGEHLYLYNGRPADIDCSEGPCVRTGVGSVTVARVRWAGSEYLSSDNYEYYSGSSTQRWSRDATLATDILPGGSWPSGDGLSVAWYPQIQRYVMAHAGSAFTPTSSVSLRTSTTPWGPWTSPVAVGLDASSSHANSDGGCTGPTPCRTFTLHPELSAGTDGQLDLSYVRHNDMATTAGESVTVVGKKPFHVRLGAVGFDVLAPAVPDTTLISFPADPVPSATAEFSFSSEVRPATAGDPAASPVAVEFRCRLDSEPSTSCTSPVTYRDLSPGAHTFSVAAVDATGIGDPQPATYTWSVDLAAPDTHIVQGPPSPSTPESSTFEFAGIDDQTGGADMRFLCSIDGAPEEPCGATWTAITATTGLRTLTVRAIDRAGNTDATPAVWAWSIDAEPVVTFTSVPKPYTRDTNADFWFTITDDLTPQDALMPACSVDGAPFVACTAPVSHVELAAGAHSFAVRVSDSTGNTALAIYEWVVDLAAPAGPTLAGPGPFDNESTATFELASTDDHSASANVSFECSLDDAGFATCPAPATFEGLAPDSHVLSVRALDQAGNQSEATLTAWLVDMAPPTVEITDGPADGTAETNAVFTLTGADDRTFASDLAYECAMDAKEFAPCASPATFGPLSTGPHTLAVRSVDQADNISAVATHPWQIAFAVTSPMPREATTGLVYEHAFLTNAAEDAPWTTWMLMSGTLPYGMRVWGGVLSGTPLNAGTFGPITVAGTSPLGTVTQTFTLTVHETDSIVGAVTNRVTGAPIANIRVRAYNAADALAKHATTATDGSYALGYLQPGTYRLTFTDPVGNHLTEYGSGASSLATATPIDVVDGRNVRTDATLQPANIITGNVTNGTTGNPAVGVWVTLYTTVGTSVAMRTTGTDGRYWFRNIPAGTYRMLFSDLNGGYVREYWSDAFTFSSATDVSLATGSTVTVSEDLQPLSPVTGRVTNQSTGAAVSGIWVTMFDVNNNKAVGLRITDTLGTYTFRVPAGTYKVSFLDPARGYVTQYWTGATTLDEAKPIVLTGAEAVTADAALVLTGSMAGTVTSSTTGAPISGARVTLMDANGAGLMWQFAGTDGSYRFASIAPGRYLLSVSDPAGVHFLEYWSNATSLSSATTLEVAPGGAVVADVALDPFAAIDGTVTSDVMGEPVANIRVTLIGADGTGLAMTTTTASGTYRFTDLRAASYRLSFGDATGTYFAEYSNNSRTLAGATAIALQAGTTAAAHAALEPISVITGRVTGADGTAIGGARVTLFDATGKGLMTIYTATDGTFRVSNLRMATYKLGFGDPNGDHKTEYWSNAPTLDTATGITTTGGTFTADAELAAV